MAKAKILTYDDGVSWIAVNERPEELSLTGMRFSPAVILLGHLFGKRPVTVAEAVLALRKKGG